MNEELIRFPEKDGYQPSPENGYQIVAFNQRQLYFVERCMKISSVNFQDEYGGYIPDPFTGDIIAAVFYFQSSKLLYCIMNIALMVLEDKSSRRNRDRCIKFKILTESEKE